MFENAKWIENPGCAGNCAPLFRKTLQLSEVKNAEIAVCGLGFYVLTINGQRVSDELLTPPFTAYDKHVLYQIYDITECLVPGENVIELICGNGWFNPQVPVVWGFEHVGWKAAPKVICQVTVNGACVLVSDSSWETTGSKTTFNSIRSGETYDAAMKVQNFHNAIIARGPGGVLVPQKMPPVKLQGSYIGKRIFSRIYDFGQSITGNVEITVQGSAGAMVKIRYSERIRSDGSLDREEVSAYVKSDRFAEDQYLLKGDGEETWHGDFSFHGFRYVKLLYPDTVKILSVKARDMHTDIAVAGDFSCNIDTINLLHKACVRALLTNYIHIPMDCPHREKNGWTADAMLSSFQALYNLDMKESYLKWLDDIVDTQRPNGAVCCIAPTCGWGYQWGSGATWDAALFVLPWNIYRFTGDISVISRYYPAMEAYLAFLETQSDNDIFTNGLGDWCPPEEAPPCDASMMVTCYAKHIFDLFAQMSALLGNEDQENYAKRRSEEIRKAFLQTFLKTHIPGQTFYAALVYFDMVEDKQWAADRLAESVKQAEGHICAGIFGAHMVPIVLRDYGYFDLAWDMVCKEEYPGWIYLMNQCHGTMGEQWRGNQSLDHHMFTSVDGFIQASLSGLCAEQCDPGFQTVRLKPYFPKGVGKFSFWHRTVLGILQITWDKNNYCVTVPEGIRGTLEINGDTHCLRTGENVFVIKNME